jgi:hypothetical protein
METTRPRKRRRRPTRREEGFDTPERRAQGFMARNRGTICLLGAATSSWMIYDLASTTEGPSQSLALMKYLLLAVMVTATLVTGAQWLTMK